MTSDVEALTARVEHAEEQWAKWVRTASAEAARASDAEAKLCVGPMYRAILPHLGDLLDRSGDDYEQLCSDLAAKLVEVLGRG